MRLSELACAFVPQVLCFACPMSSIQERTPARCLTMVRYAATNRLGALRSDHDIFQTFEGDNTVLKQQVSRLAFHLKMCDSLLVPAGLCMQ